MAGRAHVAGWKTAETWPRLALRAADRDQPAPPAARQTAAGSKQHEDGGHALHMTSGNIFLNKWVTDTLAAGVEPDDICNWAARCANHLYWRREQFQTALDLLTDQQSIHRPGAPGAVFAAGQQAEAVRVFDRIALLTQQIDDLQQLAAGPHEWWYLGGG